MGPMTTTDNPAEGQAADHRRKALEYLGAAQEAQRIVDRAYEDHPDPAHRPPAVSRLVGGLNQSIRLGLRAAQVHATLATMPLPPAYLEPPELLDLWVDADDVPGVLGDTLRAVDAEVRNVRRAAGDEHEAGVREAVEALHRVATVAQDLVQTW